MSPIWLGPPKRLSAFAATHSDIDLRTGATLHHVDFAREGIDMAVRRCVEPLDGLHMTRLRTDALIAVCSPRLADAGLRKPSDLARHTLLHLDDREDWLKWLENAGVFDADLSAGPA